MTHLTHSSVVVPTPVCPCVPLFAQSAVPLFRSLFGAQDYYSQEQVVMTLCFCLSVHCWRHCLSFEVYILLTRCPALLLQCQMHRQHRISIAMLASSACLLAALYSGHAPWEPLSVFGYAACILCAGKDKNCKVEQAACLFQNTHCGSHELLCTVISGKFVPYYGVESQARRPLPSGTSLQEHPAKHEMTSKTGSSPHAIVVHVIVVHVIVVHACRQL